MSETSTPNTATQTKTPRRFLSARRVTLMSSVAGMAALVLAAGAGFGPTTSFNALTAPAYAQNLQRPAGFADIVEKVKPAVISVRVRMGVDSPRASSMRDNNDPFGPGSPFEEFFRRFGRPDNMPGQRGGPSRRNFTTGQGSGFLISADGYAVTNNHVVDKAEKVEVTTDAGKTYTAKVIGTDPRTDLALIKLDDASGMPFVRLSEAAPRIGDWVLAVGNPFGLGGTVTAGIVSARGRDIGAGPYDDFIQIDAPVNKGNSGGPTFDVDGNVIGVNTAIFSPSGGDMYPLPHIATSAGSEKHRLTEGMVPLARLERARISTNDFESFASTIPPQGHAGTGLSQRPPKRSSPRSGPTQDHALRKAPTRSL